MGMIAVFLSRSCTYVCIYLYCKSYVRCEEKEQEEKEREKRVELLEQRNNKKKKSTAK